MSNVKDVIISYFLSLAMKLQKIKKNTQNHNNGLKDLIILGRGQKIFIYDPSLFFYPYLGTGQNFKDLVFNIF